MTGVHKDSIIKCRKQIVQYLSENPAEVIELWQMLQDGGHRVKVPQVKKVKPLVSPRDRFFKDLSVDFMVAALQLLDPTLEAMVTQVCDSNAEELTAIFCFILGVDPDHRHQVDREPLGMGQDALW